MTMLYGFPVQRLPSRPRTS